MVREPLRPPDTMYYCKLCGRMHRRHSKKGQAHLKYKREAPT